MRRCRLQAGWLWLAAVGCAPAAGEAPWAVREVSEGQVFAGGRQAPAAELEAGRQIYLASCAGCHGLDGDGRGPLSHGMSPPPRDLRAGAYKFASVPAGKLPTDDDLARLVRDGLRGTAMHAMGAHPGVDAVVQFIKTFPGADGPSPWLSRRRGKPARLGRPVDVPPDPWESRERAAAEGAAVYHLEAQCSACHPSYLARTDIAALARARGDLPPDGRPDPTEPKVVLARDNPYGVDVPAIDFARQQPKSVRPGRLEDMYRVIAAGVGGLMPAWSDSLPPRKLWALAHYVASLSGADGGSP